MRSPLVIVQKYSQEMFGLILDLLALARPALHPVKVL
jgi:hypothetical protein